MAKAKVIKTSRFDWKKWAKRAALVVGGAAALQGYNMTQPTYVEAFTLMPGEQSIIMCPAPVPCNFMIDKETDDMVASQRPMSLKLPPVTLNEQI